MTESAASLAPRVIRLRPSVADEAPKIDIPFTTPPEPFEWMSELAVEHWNRLAPLIVLRPSELTEFAAYCEALSEFQESTDMIKDVGLVVPDPATGLPTSNPLTGIRDRADRKLAFWANRFRGA